MKGSFGKITLTIGLVLLAQYSYATGPGFRDDVNNWSNQYHNNDDNHCGDEGNCNDDCNNNEIPLDGGLSFLAAAGAAYGIKRIRDNRKAK